jgi:hypothetical protein
MRRFLIFLLAALAALVLGAHVWRAGSLLLALVVALVPLLLVAAGRHDWPRWTVQGVLLVGALEWVRTLFALVERRQLLGLPWVRLAVILGSVAAVTALAAWAVSRWPRREPAAAPPGGGTATLATAVR